MFGNLKHLLVQRKIELLDDPTLLRQLRVLEERKAPNGSVSIEPSHAQKDDVAVAVALAALDLSRRPPKREPYVEVIPVAPAYESSISRPRPESSFSRSRFLERGWIRISD
jgi:hypothetical protein